MAYLEHFCPFGFRTSCLPNITKSDASDVSDIKPHLLCSDSIPTEEKKPSCLQDHTCRTVYCGLSLGTAHGIFRTRCSSGMFGLFHGKHV